MWTDDTRRADRRTGILAAIVCRAMGNKDVEVFDFFPEHKDEEEEARRKAEKIRANMKGLTEATRRIK